MVSVASEARPLYSDTTLDLETIDLETSEIIPN